MRNWSIGIGHLFGSELRIHVSFLFLLAFVWITDAASLGASAGGRALGLTLIVLGSVLLHQAGHFLFSLRQNDSGDPAAVTARRVVILMPIGDVSLSHPGSRPAPSPEQELKNAVLAPALNLLAALLLASAVTALMPELELHRAPLVTAANLPRSAIWINVVLALLNFLPAYPMDAGRVLRAMFLRRVELVPATRRAVAVGQLFALAFFAAGIWNAWWMLIGLFLFLAAQLEERSVVFQAVLQQVKLQEIMLTDFATLSPGDTLEYALEKAVHTLQDDFPVVRGGDMVGVISRRNIVDALRENGNGYVQSAMKRVFGAAGRSDTLASVFASLTTAGSSLLPIVEEGRLVGIVTLQNLMHSMALVAEKRRAGLNG